MEDWVLCNKCYRPLRNSRVIFSLTECQHIFCSECILTDKSYCPECKTPTVKTLPLQRPLQEFVAEYFEPVSELNEKTLLVSEFQNIQNLITCRRHCELEEKYAELKKFYWKAKANTALLEEAYKKLRDDTVKCMNDWEIECLTMRVRETPCLTIHEERPEKKVKQEERMIAVPLKEMARAQPASALMMRPLCTANTINNENSRIHSKETRHYASASSQQLYYKFSASSLHPQRCKRHHNGRSKDTALKPSTSTSSSTMSLQSVQPHKRITTESWMPRAHGSRLEHTRSTIADCRGISRSTGHRVVVVRDKRLK